MSSDDRGDGGARGTDPIGLGLLIGGVVGIAEVLVRIGVGYTAVTHVYFFESALLYGILGAAAGIGLRLLAALRRRPFAGPVCLALLVAFFVFVLVVGYANIYWLGRFTEWRSLTASGAILLGSLALAWLLARLFTGIAGGGGGSGRARARWLLAGLVLLGLAGLASIEPGGSEDGSQASAGADWNVVVILSDTLRPDHLSTYGYERETSPEIDAWARTGVVFENAMAHSSWTKPSTASILTSLYPSTHRVSGSGSGLPPSAEPLAEILDRAGFRTAIFTGNSYVTPVFGFDQGVDDFWGEDQPRLRQLLIGHMFHMGRTLHPVIRFFYENTEALERRITGSEALPEGKVRAETLTRPFWSWLDEVGDDRFFAYLHYVDAHSPYDPLPPYDRAFMPERFSDPKPGPGSYEVMRRYGATPDGLEQLVALYDGEILYFDHWFGEVIHDLERRGLLEKTLVVFTTDHGEELADHGDFGHGKSLYQEQLHVALMMSFPEGVAPGAEGRRFAHVVRHVDLLPTILDVLELPAPEGIAGRSLMPIVRGEEPEDPPRVVFSEVDRRAKAASLLVGSHKLIRELGKGGHRTLAFDLATDGGEQHSLAEAEAPWRDALVDELERFEAGAAEEAIPEHEVRVDDASKERLRALGYVVD